MINFQKIYIAIYYFPRKLCANFVNLYQKTISPDHGGILRIFYPHGYCRFTPSCSEYSKQAFLKYGVMKGFLKSLWRILRCNPWNKGGHDPV